LQQGFHRIFLFCLQKYNLMGYASRRNLSKWDTLRVEIVQNGMRFA